MLPIDSNDYLKTSAGSLFIAVSRNNANNKASGLNKLKIKAETVAEGEILMKKAKPKPKSHSKRLLVKLLRKKNEEQN